MNLFGWRRATSSRKICTQVVRRHQGVEHSEFLTHPALLKRSSPLHDFNLLSVYRKLAQELVAAAETREKTALPGGATPGLSLSRHRKIKHHLSELAEP